MRKTKEQNLRLKENKGITLIALVITVIVMIVLVGVSISMAVNGGLFDYAKNAAGETKNAINEEQALAEGKIKIGDTWYNSIDEYISEETKVDFEELFKTATKHPNQTETNDIGIAEDGSIVNLDMWIYSLAVEVDEYILGSFTGTGSALGTPGYDYDYIKDGQIQGKVPMYIKEEGESDFYPVTRMDGTFYDCSDLTIAPKIPSTVTSMVGTFYACSNLTIAPKIPSTVTSMDFTFRSCINLTTAPKIPSTVTSMEETFASCQILTTAPEIPSSVTNMSHTFYGCHSLTGELKINANTVNEYDMCLMDVATNEGCALVLTGPNQEALNNILSTATSGNVTIKQ